MFPTRMKRTRLTQPHRMKEKRMGIFLSQIEMAKLLGLSPSYYNKLEAGKAKPSDKLIKLFDYVVSERKKRYAEIEISPEKPLPESIENGLNKQTRYIEVLSRCVKHITRYALQCLTENPDRLLWFEEELKNRFAIRDKDLPPD